MVILTDMTGEQYIAPVAEKIIASNSKPYEDLDGHQVITSHSTGIAVYTRNGDDVESLIMRANAAMYKSKNSGRGRYRFFDTNLNTVSVEKFELEQLMPMAIVNNEVVLYWRPKLLLKTPRGYLFTESKKAKPTTNQILNITIFYEESIIKRTGF